MITKTYKIDVDFNNQESSCYKYNITFNNDDVGVAYINAILKSNDELIDLSKYTNVTLDIKNRTSLICDILNDGEIRVNIPNELLMEIGTNKFTITLHMDGFKLVSPTYMFRIKD